MSIPVTQVISHWSHFFKDFSVSSDLLYSEIEKVLKSHNMPNAAIGRTKLKEGGMLSAAREYLRVKHGELVFDICASPFGKDFFISWWLYESESAMKQFLSFTKVGEFLKARASKRTFYQMDEEEMFRSCVHECIQEAIESATSAHGFRQLSDSEKAFKAGGM